MFIQKLFRAYYPPFHYVFKSSVAALAAPFFVAIFLLATPSVSLAQGIDTVSLGLQDADRLFLRSNLLLLAGQFNLQVADAQAIQAKLYPNPVFTADFNLYDPENKKLLHTGQSGQKAFAIQQIILLGGKRKSLIELARQNRELATYELEDLLRNLRFQLHTSLYTIHQQQAVLRRYRTQLDLLDTIINNYEVQGRLGNIPLKEVVRLKAARLQFTTSRSDAYKSSIEEMGRLRLLLRTEAYVLPLIDETALEAVAKGGQLQSWLQMATTNRPDLKAAEVQTRLANANFIYQKQLAIPDMTVNSSYDQRGGAFKNQVNAGLSIDLPVWNRNRGGIAQARVQTQSAQNYRDQALAQVRTEVLTANDNLRLCIQEYRNAQRFYNPDFESVYKGVSDNFRKRNISLTEFVDFIESYTQAMVGIESAKTQLGIAGERINFTTTAPIF